MNPTKTPQNARKLTALVVAGSIFGLVVLMAIPNVSAATCTAFNGGVPVFQCATDEGGGVCAAGQGSYGGGSFSGCFAADYN